MSLFVLSCFTRNLKVLQRASSVPCFKNRLCFLSKLSTNSRLNYSSSSAVPDQFDESEDQNVLNKDTSNESQISHRESNETIHFHNILENLKPYQNSILTKNHLLSLQCEVNPEIERYLTSEYLQEASLDELLSAFRHITSYAKINNFPISMPQFDAISKAMSKRLHEFSDDDFMEIGKLLSLWPRTVNTLEPNFKRITNTYDGDCCTRYSKRWYSSREVVKILLTADIIFWQRIGIFSHYLRLTIFHYSHKIKEPHHLIQLLFYLAVIKSAPSSYKFYDMEKKLFTHRNNYSIFELAAVVYAMFRMKSRLQFYPLMQHLLEKSLDNLPALDDHTLICMAKGLQFSPKELHPQLKEFQRQILTRIDDFKLITCVHALYMFAGNQVLSEEFGNTVYKKVLQNVGELRSKELSRVITVFTENLSHERDLKLLAEKIAMELRDPSKSKFLFRVDFIQGSTLHRLLACGAQVDDLVDQYLSSKIAGKKSYEALAVDTHMEVFCPQYKGARLDPEAREDMYKYKFEFTKTPFVKSSGAVGKRSQFNMQETQYGQGILLGLLGDNTNNLLIRRLVPYFGNVDVLVHVSQDGTYLSIPQSMIDSKPWDIVRIPSEAWNNGSKFIALSFLTSVDEYAIKNIRFVHRHKKSILKELGFIYLEVFLSDWEHLNPSEQQTDLQKKITYSLS